MLKGDAVCGSQYTPVLPYVGASTPLCYLMWEPVHPCVTLCGSQYTPVLPYVGASTPLCYLMWEPVHPCVILCGSQCTPVLPLGSVHDAQGRCSMWEPRCSGEMQYVGASAPLCYLMWEPVHPCVTLCGSQYTPVLPYVGASTPLCYLMWEPVHPCVTLCGSQYTPVLPLGSVH